MASQRSFLRLSAAVVIIGVAVAVYLLRPAADAGTPSEGEPAAQTIALPRLLDLGADKCIPCKLMAPILEKLEQDYDGILTVEFIDVWKNPAAAEPYGIRVIPTQIFFSAEGSELFRHQGFYSREDILGKWRELGVNLPDRGV